MSCLTEYPGGPKSLSAPGKQNSVGLLCSFVPMEKASFPLAHRSHGHDCRASAANSVIKSQEESRKSTFERVETPLSDLRQELFLGGKSQRMFLFPFLAVANHIQWRQV